MEKTKKPKVVLNWRCEESPNCEPEGWFVDNRCEIYIEGTEVAFAPYDARIDRTNFTDEDFEREKWSHYHLGLYKFQDKRSGIKQWCVVCFGEDGEMGCPSREYLSSRKSAWEVMKNTIKEWE